MADDSNFDDDLSINEYNSNNFAEELIFFINIFKAMDRIHKDIFSRLPGGVPAAPKKIIGKVDDHDFEKKNPYFSDSRVMAAMMIDIVTYGWERFTRKFAEVNIAYTSYKRMTLLKACKACDIENYFLEMVFFYRLLFWKSKIEEEEEAKKSARIVKMLQTKRARIAKMLQELKEEEQKREETEENGSD